MNSRIEIVDKSKRNPKNKISANSERARSENNSGYEK